METAAVSSDATAADAGAVTTGIETAASSEARAAAKTACCDSHKFAARVLAAASSLASRNSAATSALHGEAVKHEHNASKLGTERLLSLTMLLAFARWYHLRSDQIKGRQRRPRGQPTAIRIFDTYADKKAKRWAKKHQRHDVAPLRCRGRRRRTYHTLRLRLRL